MKAIGLEHLSGKTVKIEQIENTWRQNFLITDVSDGKEYHLTIEPSCDDGDYITLYDLAGRQAHEKNLEDAASFVERVDRGTLETLAAGMEVEQ